MRAVLVPLAASTLALQPREPPEKPAEAFTVHVEADDRATTLPGESIERVLEEVADGVKKRKKWLFLTADPAKAELFVRVVSHRVREEHVTTLGTRVKLGGRRESRDDIQAIDIVDVNELSERHYVLASVRVLGLGRAVAGYDGRRNGASLERASTDLAVQIENFLKANYWDLVERRRRFAAAGLELPEPEAENAAPAASPTMTAPDLDPGFDSYRMALERYRRGDFVPAAMALSNLTADELYRASTLLLASERTDAEWKAAALLHTECVVTLPRSLSSPLELARRTAFHLETAKRYSQAIGDSPRRERFLKLWHLAAAYSFHAGFQSTEAVAVLSWGLRLFPGDPDLLYAYGVFQEAAGALKGDRDRLTDAETVYRHLAELEARPIDLDVRLAHVLLNLGRTAEAEEKLQSARRDVDGGDAALAAWMLDGELARHRGDWRRARLAFANAWKIDETCQSCAVALAAAYERTGSRESGSEFVARWLEVPAPGGHDGWWRFLLGPAARFESALAELRSEALAP